MTNISIREKGDYLQVDITGEVTLLKTNELKEKIKEHLLKAEKKNLILDLSEVPLIDSSGLGMLISLFKYLNQQDGKIIYVGVTEYVRKVIGFAKLDQIFTLVETMEDAEKLI